MDIQKNDVAFERDASSVKVGRLRTLLSRYWDSGSHVAKRLSDKGYTWKRVVPRLQIKPEARWDISSSAFFSR